MRKYHRVPENFRGVVGVLVSPCVCGRVLKEFVGKVILSRDFRGEVFLSGVDWGSRCPDDEEYPKGWWSNWDHLVAAENRG